MKSLQLACGLLLILSALALPARAGDEDDLTPDLAKKLAAALSENKLTLTQAIATAEANCKGQAVLADCELEDGKLTIGVYCVAGDKVLDLSIEGKSGKVTETRELGKKDAKAKKGEEDEDDISPQDARTAVKQLNDAKTTLAKAMATAEESCKGKAVMTMCEIEKGKLNVAVFCLSADNKLMDIDVDPKTGKIAESREVKPVKGEKKEAKENKKP